MSITNLNQGIIIDMGTSEFVQQDKVSNSIFKLSKSRIIVCATIITIGFFSLTNPKTMPSFILLISFAILAGFFYVLSLWGLDLSGLGVKLPPSYHRSIILTLTILPTLLLILQSIGQLTTRDIITMGGLCVVGVFYIGRMFRR